MQYAASTPAGDPADDAQERWDRVFDARYAPTWDNAEPEDKLSMMCLVFGSVKTNRLLSEHFRDIWEAAIREREGM